MSIARLDLFISKVLLGVLIDPRLKAVVVSAMGHIIEEGLSGVKVGGDFSGIDNGLLSRFLGFLEIDEFLSN